MNCIFCCLFKEEKYVDMFFLFLESIFIYGNLDDNTEILVYTSTTFMNKIKESHLYNYEKIKFEINDLYNTTDIGYKAKLDFFKLNSISNYKKIIYLDIDILVKNDMKKLFNVCNEDILYVLEEGEINSDTNYWGKTLFGNEIDNYIDKSAFTSRILLFNNCDKIKDLFNKINEDIINRPYDLHFYYQSYIIYNAFKYNLFNNKILKSFIINHNNDNDNDNDNDIILYHFSGPPEKYENKINNMNIFLNNIKDFTINNNINKTKKYIDANLLSIINDCGEKLEGNIFMLHHTINYTDVYLNKVKNISNLLLNKNIKNVMEIGFNSGFSALLMLLTNPNIHITCFDIAEHKYTIPCYEKIKETFGDRINIIIGDSTKTLNDINDKYDLIHIDGGHTVEIANCDIINSYRLSKKGTILIMDDYDFERLYHLWNNYIAKYNLKPLNINLYYTLMHDIKYV